jgi:hypothetical protein
VDGGGGDVEGGAVVRQPHLGEGARLGLADEDAIGGVAGHGHRAHGAAAQPAEEIAVGADLVEAGAAEPGPQIHDIEIAPRRQGRAGAAALPIGDEIERLRARLVRAERLAGDGDRGGQAALSVWLSARDSEGGVLTGR